MQAILFFAQCSVCALATDQVGLRGAEGINAGIIYLMLSPLLLILGIGFILYRMQKKKSTEKGARG